MPRLQATAATSHHDSRTWGPRTARNEASRHTVVNKVNGPSMIRKRPDNTNPKLSSSISDARNAGRDPNRRVPSTNVISTVSTAASADGNRAPNSCGPNAWKTRRRGPIQQGRFVEIRLTEQAGHDEVARLQHLERNLRIAALVRLDKGIGQVAQKQQAGEESQQGRGQPRSRFVPRKSARWGSRPDWGKLRDGNSTIDHQKRNKATSTGRMCRKDTVL